MMNVVPEQTDEVMFSANSLISTRLLEPLDGDWNVSDS